MSTDLKLNTNLKEDKSEKQLIPRVVKEEDLPFDFYLLASMLTGMISLILRFKFLCWITLIFLMGSLFNLKKGFVDTRNLITVATFVLLGLFMNYFGPKTNLLKTK